MLPSFFIIGAARAATTTLWSTLNEHPDVFLPDIKEPHYLLGGSWACRGQSWYESLFDGAGRATQLGEASTGYSMFPIFMGVPERAAALVPEARIIYMIRHPVRRMVSHWVQATTSGREHQPLEEALVWRSIYYFASCYGLQLSQWLQWFPKEAFLVLRSEDLDRDPAAVLDQVLTHLGLTPGWRPRELAARRNATDAKLRALRPIRIVSGALRGAGFEPMAWRVARRSRIKRLAGLMAPFQPPELQLPRVQSERLLDCFRADFALLRGLLGAEPDLYGLA